MNTSLDNLIKGETYSSGLLGWRKWKLNGNGQLCPLTSIEPWTTGENIARCGKKKLDHSDVPNSNCECGLYAHYQPNATFKYIDFNSDPTIFGLVLGRGKVELHASGFRAERMTVLGLINGGSLLEKKTIEDYQAFSFDCLSNLINYAESLASKNNFISVVDLDPMHSYKKELGDTIAYKTLDSSGRLNSKGDDPAIEYENGRKEWRHHGLLHRENGPAIVCEREIQYTKFKKEFQYWQKGIFYREDDLPTKVLEVDNGEYHYWHNDKNQVHRDNDLPAYRSVADPGYYWRRGSLRLINSRQGPKDWQADTMNWPGIKQSLLPNNRDLLVWQKNGMIHRSKGPAVMVPGVKDAYWVYDIPYNKEEWLKWQKKNFSSSLRNTYN